MLRNFKPVLLLVVSLIVTGCKEILYSDLLQSEANEMIAILSAAEIDAAREIDKNGIYSVLVNSDEVAQATVVLRQANLPGQKFQSLGDVFSASSIIGTPFEQHARYLYAMNEEMSRTIAGIEGVTKARVTVNAPAEDRYAREEAQASASVTVHHEPEFDTAANIAKFKQILSHSVPNLAYDNVSVVFFPSSVLKLDSESATAQSIGPEVQKSQIFNIPFLNENKLALVALAFLLLGVLFALWVKIGVRLLVAAPKRDQNPMARKS